MTGRAGALPPAIQIRNLSKSYGPAWAVRGVTLDVERGEAVAVFGANGAGKSTLIRLLATLTPPSLGTLRLLGQDAGLHPRRVRPGLGVLGHQSYLYGDLTAAENLELYAHLYGLADGRRRVQEALAAAGLAGRATHRVRDLSRGMQQRLALARATIHEPAVLLLDEPDNGLDSAGRAYLAHLLAAGQARGQAVILATHQWAIGLTLCGRALILAHGQVVHDAPVARHSPDEWHNLCVHAGAAGR